MTKSEFNELDENNLRFFEYQVDVADSKGHEVFLWLHLTDVTRRVEEIPTLKGIHLLKYNI